MLFTDKEAEVTSFALSNNHLANKEDLLQNEYLPLVMEELNPELILTLALW